MICKKSRAEKDRNPDSCPGSGPFCRIQAETSGAEAVCRFSIVLSIVFPEFCVILKKEYSARWFSEKADRNTVKQ